MHPSVFLFSVSEFLSFQNIPMTFFSNHVRGTTKEDNAVVKLTSDASDKTWEVKMDGRRLTRGWQNFANGHGLRVGDIVIFRRDGDLLFHVTSFGPSCCQILYDDDVIQVSSDSEKYHQDTREEGSPSDNACFVARVTASNLSRDMLFFPRDFSRSNGLMDRTKPVLQLCSSMYNRDSLRGSSSSSRSQERFLTLTLTTYSLRKSKLCLPGKFVWLNGMENARKITLVDRYGVKRTTSLRTDNKYGAMRMGKGWRDFCEANGVKAGDSFKLELIEEEGETATHLLKFCPKV
ncbi:hypothetical protein F2Q70_00023645 [Brassica cretica]|uniref:TF-B3 domain-containing protein n=1 Tax=Brassica cretica TaxID=69181 RepID=A0A8S9GLR7_BRACR|nr:hypothetical protein F2Q70_00023645 [Brassica cretica]